jgi:GTP-binding protein
MKITSAHFVKGLVQGDTAYDPETPQVVIYGRSNAGKSTMINTIVGRNSMARVSQNPGRTREANLYLINKSWYLIDMPGYGYAKTSKTDREMFADLIHWFIRATQTSNRKSILILDSKIGLTDLDREILHELTEMNESITIILNKVDRLKQRDVMIILNKVKSEVSPDIDIIPFSSRTGKGLAKVHAIITGDDSVGIDLR